MDTQPAETPVHPPKYGTLLRTHAARRVFVGKEPVELAPKEYSILEYLMHHREQVVSAEELIEHIWESDADLFSNSFKVHLHTLKKKLDGAGGAGQYIVTRRGQGYLIKELGEDML